MVARNILVLVGAYLLATACGEGAAPVVLDSSVNADLVEVAADVPAGQEVAAEEAVVDGGEDLPDISTFELLDDGDAGTGPLPGEPGYPCETGDDCNSAFCIQTPAGKQCTMACMEECPFDWVCVQHEPSLPDEILICVPLRMNLCKPCLKNSDCLTDGAQTGDACLPYGAAGDFCGASCMGDEDCPSGYECQSVLDIWGYESHQCVLAEGQCQCQPWFVDEQATTMCEIANDSGVCEGERLCTAQGLSPCDAPVPAPEACNEVDDDCDGEVDEDAGGDTCFVENQWGACKGVYLCDDGALDCDAPEPEAETCDGNDNDCDGAADEGYPDSDGDGLADCLENDKDGDGILDFQDNCPAVPNPGQGDFDLDDKGDACDQDDDNDLTADGEDCGPKDPAVHPGAEETCDGKDNDCDDLIDEGFPDSDSDALSNCIDDDDDNDGFVDASDCSPENKFIFPGANEVCDGVDNDCDFDVDESFPDTDLDGLADCVDADKDDDGVDNQDDNCPTVANEDQLDGDGDGWGDACDTDLEGDGIPDAVDNCPEVFNPGQKDLDEDGAGDACDDDQDGDEVPDAEDNCPFNSNPDQLDDDDDGTGNACDSDADGDGDPDATDCMPENPYVYSGAVEECDGLDNNCNGVPDEGFSDSDFDGNKDCIDVDDDDDGDFDVTDCAPLNPAVHFGALESCNGIDDNCDGQVDEDTGSLACGKGECFHTTAACIGGVAQTCDPLEGVAPEECDGKDNDCDGLVDEDLGWTSCGVGACANTVANCQGGIPQVCEPKEGGETSCGLGVCAHTVSTCVDGIPQDCDPVEGFELEECDGLDNDCDGDVDDNLGTTTCGAGLCLHTVNNCIGGIAQVCDEMEGAGEEKCDGIDNDCDGAIDEGDAGGCQQYFKDGDNDGHGTEEWLCLCLPLGLYKAVVGDDCNDLNPWVFPGATELCDGVDNDCDNETDEDGATGCSWYYADADNDGFGSGEPQCTCSPPGDGWSVLGGDCDEDESGVHPGSLELCNEVDDDCDEQVDEGYDLDTDPQNCGVCGYLCQPNNALGNCLDSECTIDECVAGYGNCDFEDANGCEVNVLQDVSNCGQCGEVCNLPHAAEVCIAGKCEIGDCDDYYEDTDGVADTGCEDFTYGGSAENAGSSCLDISNVLAGAEDGEYWIKPDPEENAYVVYCDMTTDGGGWTLTIKGTLDAGYNNSFNKTPNDSKGFMKSFDTLDFSDVLVKMGGVENAEYWVSFHGVASGNQTLDNRIKNCCSGNYSVDYNVDAPHHYTNRSATLAGIAETEALSFRMSQTAGPNDAMFFVVTVKSRDAASGYSPQNYRYVDNPFVSVLLGWGPGQYDWNNWESWTGWTTGCGNAGYYNGSTSNCTATGAVFIR